MQATCKLQYNNHMSIDSFVTGVVMTAGAAAAATGGMVAGENQTVVTGDSSASVQVTNIVNADGNGGSSYTEIIKTVDGNTTKEVKEETYAPGEPVVVKTNVEAVSEAHSSGADINNARITDTSTTTEELLTVLPEVSSSTPVSKIVEKAHTVVTLISQFFHSVFDIFSR